MSGVRRVLVVGASLAGVAAAEGMRDLGFDGEIVLVGEERHRPYDRPPLSKQLLAGEVAHDQLGLRPEGWYADRGVELVLGSAAAELDPAARALTLHDGQALAYDGLVIATGSRARSFPGPALDGLHTLRTLDDSLAIGQAIAAGARRVVVVGGGFIGAEVAASARALGCSVTMVEATGAPLSRVVGDVVGAACGALQRDHGVDVRCGVAVEAIEGPGSVQRVRLADGSAIEADLAVVGFGAQPNTEWLDSSGVRVDDGVLCDAYCRASRRNVVAAGDVARWEHPTLGSLRIEHWEHAVSQGRAAAQSLVAPDRAQPFAPVPYVWSDQFDCKIQMVGRPAPGDEVFVVDGDLEMRRFVALYGRGGRLTAGITFNVRPAVRRIRALLAGAATLPDALTEFGAERALAVVGPAADPGASSRQIRQRRSS